MIILSLISSLLILLTVYVTSLRRKLKQACQKIRCLETTDLEKDKFFTVMAHDLNGFVNTGHAALQLYRSGVLPDKDAGFVLDSIEEKFHTASVTLQSLLNWGKLLFRGASISKCTFDMTAVINAELDLAKAAMRTKDIYVINELEFRQYVYADPEQCKFIIRNLINNALKFTRNNGIITIGISENVRPGFVVIAVKDSGIGMSPGKLEKVFFPFGESTEGTAREKGNGVGLMLCREYARRNGGDLWAESQNEIGTTFYLAVKSRTDHLTNQQSGVKDRTCHSPVAQYHEQFG